MKIIVFDRLSFILCLPWVHDVCRYIYVRTLVTDIANHITLGCPVVKASKRRREVYKFNVVDEIRKYFVSHIHILLK